MKDYVFALDQVEEKERVWFTGVLPIEDNHRSPLVGLTTDYHHWKPLAQYPGPRDHLELDAREKKLRVAVKILPKKPDEWEAYLIPIPPDTEGDPVNATSNYQCMCFHEPHDPANPPLSLRLEGFWYLDAEEAFTVFRDGEATINYFFPPDPATLRQQWPKLFPDCDFFLALTQYHQVGVEDLYWWDDPQPSKATGNSVMPQQTSGHGKKMRAARAKKSGEEAIRAEAVKLAEEFKNRHRSASKKCINDYVCGQLFDKAYKAGVLASRENAPDTIGRWLSKGQTNG